ncbi:DUF134 domain-containing protein [Mycoplasma sp. P36-A1]|uniref:DUF134 domain-containing protein n=1 Tax=Mycoplasma sp. P36-A1 TaxID=3252900 RepID=UPI003C2C4CF2
MARPIKGRKVCTLPKCNTYGPLDTLDESNKKITMTIDEYESIRLIDLENMSQEECSKKMNIARSTVQGIYNEARKKLAQSLVNGNTLLINGGKYHLCNGLDNSCESICNSKEKKPCCQNRENIK